MPKSSKNSRATKRGWETRRHNERSRAAKRGWETRRRNEKRKRAKARRRERNEQLDFDDMAGEWVVTADTGKRKK
jgi:hypothetical protein